MSKLIRLSVILISLSLWLVACEQTPAAPPGSVEALAVRVVDGDTIDVEIEGETHKVRYIGIDTPELYHPTKAPDEYAQEAYEKNRELVEGKTVYLEKDVSETDRYGRLLRYVYVGDTFVNAYLVQHGYAQVSTYPPDVKYYERFLELQREAREAGRGFWDPVLASAVRGTVVIDPDCSQYDAPGGDRENLNEEYVCFTSQSDYSVDMTGWKVNKRPSIWYTFPEFILDPGASVRLHTGTEVDTATDLYWGHNEGVWSSTHDTVYLYGADDRLMDEHSW
jgi:micrococcal nuclease